MNNRYRQLLNSLINDSRATMDDECLMGSPDGEIGYISDASQRIGYTIKLLDYIQDKHGKDEGLKILDIGTTPFTFLFKNYLKSDMYTVDLTDLFENRCKNNNVTFLKCDITMEDIPIQDHEIDIVIFTEVFEHLICKPKTIFDRIKKVLKKNGFLIFSTPNVAYYYRRKEAFLGKPVLRPVYDVLREDDHDLFITHGYSHWREFTMDELIDILIKYKFNILKSEHINMPFNRNKIPINPYTFIKRLIAKILLSLIPSLSKYNLILAQKL